MILIIALWAGAAWLAFGALTSVLIIGKPREPMTPGVAVSVVILAGLMCAAMITAAIQLAA